MRRRGRNFDYDAATGICHNPPWQATRLMNINMSLPTRDVRAFSGDTVRQDDRGTIRAANMLIRYVSVRLPLNASQFHQILAGFPNSLWYIALEGGGPAGDDHAIAAQHDGRGDAHFFDPNYGHFRFADFARFKTWMQGFLVASDYARDYRYVRFFCVV